MCVETTAVRPSVRSSVILYQRINRLLDFHEISYGDDLRRKYCRANASFVKIASATVKLY